MRTLISQNRSNLRYSSLDGFFATPWTLLSLPGSFLMAGMLNSLFEVGPLWFGIITAMPALANALQILLIPFMARFMNVRDLTLGQCWLNTGLWLSGLTGIAFLSTDKPETAGLFFAILFCLASISLALLALGWMTWVGDFVPSRIRGRYMGGRNRLASLSGLGYMVLSLVVLHWMDASRAAYLILIGLALGTRVISVMVQHRIVSPDPTGGTIASANWTKDIIDLRAHKSLLRFILFGSVAGFWMAFCGAIAPIYAFKELGASPAAFTGYAMAGTISGAVFIRIWGELIDRHGAIPVLIISLVAWRVGDFGWTLITPDTLDWMYALWTWGGIMGTGYLLASFTLLLKLIPKTSRVAGISLNLTATSVAAAIAPILAGIILSKARDFGWEIFATYRTLIAIGLVGCIASVFLLRGTREPETCPTRNNIQGAMRTLRILTVNQGLTFLSNATLVVRRKKR
jgi:hypothetical protein